MIIETTVKDSPNQLHEGCKQQCTENPKMNYCQNCLCTDCFSQNANEISEQNATVIESRNQASVGLTLLKSTGSYLSSPLTSGYADA